MKKFGDPETQRPNSSLDISTNSPTSILILCWRLGDPETQRPNLALYSVPILKGYKGDFLKNSEVSASLYWR